MGADFEEAFMSYDWLLGLGEEVRLFWRRRTTAATFLYFSIRYLVVVFWIFGYPTVSIQGVVRGKTLLKSKLNDPLTRASIFVGVGWCPLRPKCCQTNAIFHRCEVYMYITQYVLQIFVYVFPARKSKVMPTFNSSSPAFSIFHPSGLCTHWTRQICLCSRPLFRARASLR